MHWCGSSYSSVFEVIRNWQTDPCRLSVAKPYGTNLKSSEVLKCIYVRSWVSGHLPFCLFQGTPCWTLLVICSRASQKHWSSSMSGCLQVSPLSIFMLYLPTLQVTPQSRIPSTSHLQSLSRKLSQTSRVLALPPWRSTYHPPNISHLISFKQ